MKDLRSGTRRRLYGDSPVFITCPDHGGSSLAVYHDHGFCFGGCGYFSYQRMLEVLGTTEDALQEVSTDLDAQRAPVAPDVSMVKVWHTILTDPNSPMKGKVKWLRDRGISHDTIRKQRLGHTGRFYVIPVWGTDGKLQGIRYRRDDAVADPETPKYLQPKGQGALIYRPNPGGNPVAICEGELDALILAEHNIDAMTTTSGASHLPETFRGWRFKRRVYILTDQDAPGDEAADKLKAALGCESTRVCWEGAKDVTDKLRGLSRVERVAVLQEWLQ